MNSCFSVGPFKIYSFFIIAQSQNMSYQEKVVTKNKIIYRQIKILK
jgi:hypothetical protein